MRDRVMITGASGFLGFHIIEAALAMGLEVYVAVRKSSDTSHLKQFDIKYTYPDLNSISNLKNEIEKNNYRYIIHAAGITKASSQEAYNKVNAKLTYNIGKAAAMAAVELKKFVFVSSLAAVGPLQNASGILTESVPPMPVTAYGKSKLLAEEQLNELPLPLTIIRPTAIYGPREKDILILFKSINKGWEPYIGRAPQQLSFVYAKDVAEVIINALFSKYDHTTYNVSDGAVYNRYQLANYAKRVLQKKTTIMHLPLGIIKAMAFVLEKLYGLAHKVPALNRGKINELTAANWNCSIEKVAAELGFKPAYNLESGIRETLDWYKNNNWIK